MFLHKDLKGSDLPPKTLCLTYDDGPGPGTLELGRFLFSEAIRATFFVVGQHAEKGPDVLARLADWGHIIGNHTYSHPGLVALAEAGGDLVGEIARTDQLIAPFARRPRFLRAPYGNWRQKKPGTDEDAETSIVAELLNEAGAFQYYAGPINWDISGEDYEYYQRGDAPEKSAARYRREISKVERGIVLMHDGSEEPETHARNGALETTRLLVPWLKAQGYRFVGIDEIPQIQGAAAPRP